MRRFVAIAITFVLALAPLSVHASEVHLVKQNDRWTPDAVARNNWAPDTGLPKLTRNRFGNDVVVGNYEFFGGFSDGGSVDMPNETIEQMKAWVAAQPAGSRFYIVPTTNPLRYDQKYKGHNLKISAKDNAALRADRGAWANFVLDYAADVYTPGVVYDDKGVWIVAFQNVPALSVEPTPARHDTTVIHEQPVLFGDMLRLGPTGGVAYVHTNHHDYTSPTMGVMLTERRWMLDVQAGRSFQDRDDQIISATCQYFPQRWFSIGVGWVDAYTVIPFTDHYAFRSTGFIVAPAINGGGKRWNINARLGVGEFNNVDPSRLEARWMQGIVASGNVGFTF